jgi:hypothetical protein
MEYEEWVKVGVKNGFGLTTPTRAEIEDELQSIDEEALLMDGFDEAIIGFTQRINQPLLTVYSWQKMMEVLISRDGMDYEEAMEYIDYNCIGAWVGERTPIIVMPFSGV